MLPSPAPDSCILYLVRHGATENNLADPPRLQGRGADLSLSEEGARQAGQTAGLLAKRPVAAVYSSPLRRSLETARAIAQRHQLQVRPVPPIQEVDVGRWENRSWNEIAVSEPEAYRRFMEDPAEHGYVDGENMSQVCGRVMPAIEQLAAAHRGEAIVMVGHNVVNRVFLSQVIGLPLSKARSVNQDNCGVSIVRCGESAMKLLTLNATFHLQP